ncbi:hypothetical protein HAX54_021002 [Datura stramonium]|uniref:Pentatricopeptide repeat-containing protein n=1 Tax=Datura stramonium TaxID=4076 RepID=A0ABS8S562_DATST|nr:hypothetical protein [Datura stramonium]
MAARVKNIKAIVYTSNHKFTSGLVSHLQLRYAIHSSATNRPQELADQISRLLILQRYTAVDSLKFDFSDNLVDAVLVKLKLHPNASLHFFKDGKVDKAELFVEEIEKMGLELSIVTYHSLINGYVEKKDLKGVERVLRVIDEKGMSRNRITFTLLIKGYCRLCKMEEAEKVFREMKEVDEQAYGDYVEGAIADALHLWNLMLKRGVIPNAVGYGTLLDAFVNMGEFEKALVLWKHILARGHTKSRTLLNTMLKGFCKMGKMVEAELFFNKMEELGCSPDGALPLGEFTYCTLVHGISLVGKVNEAFNLRNEMLIKDLVPNIAVYNALINGLCKAGNIERALRLFNKLHLKGLSPNVITYNTLIDGYYKIGKTSETEQLLKRFTEEETFTKLFNSD